MNTAIEIKHPSGQWLRIPGTSTFTDENTYHDIDIESIRGILPPALRRSLSEACEGGEGIQVRLREFGALKACTVPLEGYVEDFREEDLHSVGLQATRIKIRMPVDDFWREDF